ncbi:MAG: 2Fe-2S ferredoxin, partial [Planctomycetes bacterium]|nr:2Fe-2S ferredoxin [Planctomycetota bacterium]
MKRASVLAMETAPDLTTPAFVFDLDLLDESVRRAREVTQGAGCRLLYSVKACAHRAVMRRILPAVEGFSCSSPFEARWTREIVRSTQSIHCTAPGLRPADIDELVTTCDYLSFNSFSQYRSAEHHEAPRAQYGLRVNPEYSLVSDERYDPCREHSKLGILPDELEASLSPDRKLPERITGLQIHTNCDSSDFGQLLETVRGLDRRLGVVLDQVAWINLGGGYLFDDPKAVDRLGECMEILAKGRHVELFT